MLHSTVHRTFLLIVLIALSRAAMSAAEPYGLEARAPVAPFLNGALPQTVLVQTGKWMVVEAFPHLDVEDPTQLLPAPGTDRLYVSTRQGQIFWFNNDPAVAAKTEFLNITNVTQGWDDCGLLGFAFHPEFGRAGSTNRGFFYVWYHYSPAPVIGPRRPNVHTPGYNRLSRFTVPDGSLVADRASEQVLINEFDRNLWHDGSGMFFGNDGFLYIAVSDEGGSFDMFQRSQTITGGLFSGVLRIDVDQNASRSHPIRRQPRPAEILPDGWIENNYTANYFVPNDNPFLDPDGGVIEELWAVGLRNPHRMTFDPPTGRIWVGDVGQNLWEEVNVIERAGNYQWVYREGFHPVTNRGVVFQKPPPDQYIGLERPPLHEYEHGVEGRCVIGGYVYRGKEFATELGGKYIFGDNSSGRIWSLTWNGTNTPLVEYLCNMPPGANYTGLSTFGIDANNELYMCPMGRPAKIYKLARAGTAAPSVSITFKAPERLSAVRAFSDLATLTPAAGLIPYDVNSPLWSDGAAKHRWISVPNDGPPHVPREQIGFSPTNEWSFPDGTVFIKHFELPNNDGTVRRLETRFLVRAAGGGVYGLTYKWRENHSDAELVSHSHTDTIRIPTAEGVSTQRWFYPGPLDCLVCHTPNAGEALGVNARQLNRSITYPAAGITDNQLRAWNHAGLFRPALDEKEIANLPALVSVDDPDASLELRARSYLDANCSHCHRPDGAAGYFDARFHVSLADQRLISGPVANQMDMPDAAVIRPGDLEKSILHQRMNRIGPLQMPPIARNRVDTNAVAIIAEWINSLGETSMRVR